MAQAHQLGAWGEDLAAGFLVARGCRVLERRFRCAGGEIDLVVRDGDIVVFVEVKARRGWSPAAPAAWVDRRKLARLRHAARRWLAERDVAGVRGYRFDVVGIACDDPAGALELAHLVAVG